MKELSIEEKAKAYDEAIKAAKSLCKITTSLPMKEYMESIFPELAESEDERIRKALIRYFTLSDEHAYNEACGVSYRDIVAWLEKQGECHISHDDEIMIEQLTEYFTTGHGLQNTNETVVEFLKGVKEKLEKQGEQKPVKKEDWCFEKGKWYVKLCHDYEGDLRHFQEGHVYQAVSETSITDGYHHVSLGSWQIPKYFRPATKEEKPQKQKPEEPQQDMLSKEKYAKAVDECIYGEQKPAEEFNGEDYGIDSLWHARNILERTLGKVEGYKTDDGILEHKCAISAVKQLAKQNNAWSEEDEKMWSQVINEIEAIKSNSSTVFEKNIAQDKIDWLKSIKERYTWKPSEEQIETIKSVLEPYPTLSPREIHNFKELLEQLKKLREE